MSHPMANKLLCGQQIFSVDSNLLLITNYSLIGVLHLGLHCILNFHFDYNSKVHALLLCTERDLSSGCIQIADVLPFGTLSLNGEFYFYMNKY